MPQSPLTALVAQIFGGTKFVPLVVDATGALLTKSAGGLLYVPCPASATTPLGAAGAIGDVIETLIIVPTIAAAGAVSIVDGSSGPTTTLVFEGGGTTALTNIASWSLALGAVSAVAGGWSVTCGAGVSAIAVGRFA